jgi:hypothetical protein
VIPEIDIWRAANLMLKRYSEKALEPAALASMSVRIAVPNWAGARLTARSGRLGQ